ncbi:MAG TPA: flagellar export protein FliJ [Methylomirabilota bacterium]|nr:flagellar export protein FliJ [Methylomirabilota bacterium]
MPFKFSLETLLNHRRHQEELVVPQLTKAHQAIQTEEMILQRLRSLAQWGEQELAQHQSEGKAGWELAIFYDFLSRVRAERRRSEERLSQAHRELETIRAELLEKRKGRRVVEVLREKSWHAYKAEMERKEQRELDEVAAVQYGRNHGASDDD